MGRLRLGQILLQAGVCQRDALRDAWEQKVLFGDRLGTNLLCSGGIEEAMLARALGHQHSVPAAWGKNAINVEDDALALLPAALATERRVVPHHLDRGVLFLLMLDPDDGPTKKEIAAVTGTAVVPVVVCEARMWNVLGRCYGVHVGMRPVPLDEMASVVRARRKAREVEADQAAAKPTAGPELQTEAEFQNLYMRTEDSVPPTSLLDLIPGKEGDEVGAAAPLDQQLAAMEQPSTSVVATPPAAAPSDAVSSAAVSPAPVSAAPAVVGVAEEEDEPLDLGVVAQEEPPLELAGHTLDGAISRADAFEAMDTEVHGPPSHLVAPPTPPPSSTERSLLPTEPPPSPEGGYRLELPSNLMSLQADFSGEGGPEADNPFGEIPRSEVGDEADPLQGAALDDIDLNLEEATALSFEEATALLDGVHGRNEIASIVLRYALSRFHRAALLTVHPKFIVGWKGVGPGLAGVVKQYRVQRSQRSVFGFVAETRAHYIGPLQTWTAHGDWVKQTGRQVPSTLAALPILVRERVVNILYGDNGHGQHVDSDVGELLILQQRIAQSYEALLSSTRR